MRSGDLGEGVQSRGSSLGCQGARGLEFLPEEEACASASRSKDGVSSPGEASSRVESVPAAVPAAPGRGSSLHPRVPTEPSPRGRGARNRLPAPGLRSSISTLAAAAPSRLHLRPSPI
ncbi:unnamed protein product [Rangifer tarandus platyrhynchus]|uniref:Uncharacterized protein n=2 Tax=Rangifer tarandus platyrhynchus TaxID=3082113 RepID=A0AC59ZFG5_RANTA|nr:unnamed protein product [Rangifer tarandus platyrhynchus]